MVMIMAVVVVIMFFVRGFVVQRGFSRFGLRVVLESVGRAQRFAIRARRGEPNKILLQAATFDSKSGCHFRVISGHNLPIPGHKSPISSTNFRRGQALKAKNRLGAAGGMPDLMVSGFAGRVKPAKRFRSGNAPRKARYCSVTWGLRT